jgi:hypothetical protein
MIETRLAFNQMQTARLARQVFHEDISRCDGTPIRRLRSTVRIW